MKLEEDKLSDDDKCLLSEEIKSVENSLSDYFMYKGRSDDEIEKTQKLIDNKFHEIEMNLLFGKHR